jgi:hypothetical protein
LLKWIEQQPATAGAAVIQACLLYDPNATFADVWFLIADWAGRAGLSREQAQPLYGKSALAVAIKSKLSREELRKRRRSVLRDRLLADGYCKSTSHAYHLARQSETTDKALAVIMAEALGGAWGDYYRRPRKTGPRRNMVKRLMLLRPPDASFADFTFDMPRELADVAEVMSQSDAHHSGAEYADEAEFLAVADKRGVDTDQARLLWNRYEEWAIEIIAGDARRMVLSARDAIAGKFEFG